MTKFMYALLDDGANNIHSKISAFLLAESMPVNLKQCKNLKFFERRKAKLVQKVDVKND